MRFFLLLSLVFCFGLRMNAQTASETEGCIPLTVTFTPPGGVSTYFWDFDNGVTSTNETPSTTYSQAGTFTVSFSETEGGPVLGTITINTFEKPTVAFVADTTFGCVPFDVVFTNNSQIPDGLTVNNYNWSFGDGNSSNLENPAHTYQDPGVFTVSLSANMNLPSCNVTTIESGLIEVSPGPDASFVTDPNPASACVPPLNVGITNETTSEEPVVSYEWDFGNGNNFTGTNPPSQVYQSDGNFPITLVVTDQIGCVDSVTQIVSIGEPLASFSLPDTVCLDQRYGIVNNGDVGIFNWTFDPTIEATFPNGNNAFPFVRFREAGPHDISLSVTTADGSCTGDTTITIFVDDPDPSFVSDPNYSCVQPFDISFEATSPDAVQWDWFFYDATTATGQTSMVTYIDTDSTIYSKNGRIDIPTTLVVTNPSGCRDTLVRLDTIYEPNALFMPDVIDGCAPLTVTFADSSDSREEIILWEFDYGDGTTDTFTNDDDHTHTYTEPGLYETVLTITNEAGCMDTSYVLEIEVGAPLDISFNGPGPLEICPGDTVLLESMIDPDDLENVDAWHFETDNGRSFHCFQEDALEWIFETETGAFDVNLTVEYNGCQNTITAEDYITVKGPIARIDYEIQCESPYDVIFRDSSYGATSVSWDFGDTTTSTMSELIHTYDDRGDYTVVLTAENASSGCPASTDTALVCVREIIADFELDSILCVGIPYNLIGDNSQDVDNDCWKGYEWSFDISGRPITTEKDTIPFFFNNSGDEVIQLVVEDINGCMDTTTIEATVYEVDANFEQDDDRICTNGTVPVNFTDLTEADTTIASWEWSFGSDEQNPSHIFTDNLGAGDSIIVTLNVQDVLGCPGTAMNTIYIYEPFSTIFTLPAGSDPNLCIGESLSFQGVDFTAEGSFLNFEWDFANGDMATGTPVSTTFNEAGQFNVVMTFTEDATGCTGQDSIAVTVQDFPEAAISFAQENDPIICGPTQIVFEGEDNTDDLSIFSWTGPENQTSFQINPQFGMPIGEHVIQLITSTVLAGCADTTSIDVTIVGPQGELVVSDSIICDGETITLSAENLVDVSSFEWDFGDGSTAVQDQTPVDHTYNVPATDTLEVTLTLTGDVESCVTPLTQDIYVTRVIADYTTDDGLFDYCSGIDIIFDNTSVDATVFDWDFGDGNTSMNANPTISYDTEGSYDVTLIARDPVSGCEDQITQTLTINDIPLFGYELDTICKRDTFQLMVDDDIIDLTPEELAQYTFQWSADFPSGTPFDSDTLAEPKIVATTDDDIDLSVIITDPDGCVGTLPITVPLFPLEDCIEIAVPNVFSPNGDGTNDFFNYVTNGIPEDGDITVLDLKIFNRWGQLVYDNNDPLNGWDGMYNGDPAPSDVYIYKMLLRVGTENRDVTFESTGDITLLR